MFLANRPSESQNFAVQPALSMWMWAGSAPSFEKK